MWPVTSFVGYIAVSAYFGLHAKTFQTCKRPLFFTYLSIERLFRRDFDLKVRCKFCHLCKWGASIRVFSAHLEKKTGDCMKVFLLHKATGNENGWRKWSDKKERKMKDGDNCIIALSVLHYCQQSLRLTRSYST